MTWRISILRDFDVIKLIRHALNNSVRGEMKVFEEDVQFDWVGTDSFDFKFTFTKLYA